MYTKKQILLCLFMFFFVSGCSFLFLASPIISGIILWKQGEAKKYYEDDYQVVLRAVKKTIKNYNLSILRQQNSKNEYVAIAGNGNRFKITVSKESPSYTLVSIRINVFGDKQLAELIYKTIDDFINVVEYDYFGKPIN